ncbi:FAD-dependent oxidoreductase [Gulosibacter sp. ACHW.36C]|uniref:NAD(P)/FAD-dependent oxidoreductase n=1 Tax=Gulosibacter sediminis TaxID=1729695 RepID=A0ABY4MYA8_9MICO|nr:FAD/NAD(P)-binding oxidoreductase [Gulosibacter sediminis]UQN13978.1 NAD(P)/FAD-dependent oxidoreductase [Gulosibacter sediminis]
MLGTSAAKTLHTSDVDIEVELFARSGGRPHNRMLVNKGVAIGLLEPDQTALPATGVQTCADTVRGIDPRTREVRLDSGDTRAYDALIIATGSRPRALDETIVGRDQAVSAGRLTTLHSIQGAVRVRHLFATTGPARVLMLGGGLVALITRSLVPGANAIGEDAARRLLDLHQPQHAAYLGRTPRVIRTHANRITVVLDDGTRVKGDLAILAHGTLPAAPAPWTGPESIPVDGHLRALHAPRQRIYAAGGVAVHHYPGHSSYRIDHWDDSTAQGAHAARALLHDLGLADDPGRYLPASPFSVRIHGHTLTGAGHPALGTSTRIVSADPLLTVHHLGDTPVALTGIDTVRLVHDWIPNLHQQTSVRR